MFTAANLCTELKKQKKITTTKSMYTKWTKLTQKYTKSTPRLNDNANTKIK